MKTAHDPRHTNRQKIVEELFGLQFHKQRTSEQAKKIMSEITTIDEQIEKAAPEFPIDKINRVDLAILRLAVYEMLIEKKAPPKVIIDEAIELAKEYGGETSPSFVNGVLGNILHHESSNL